MFARMKAYVDNVVQGTPIFVRLLLSLVGGIGQFSKPSSIPIAHFSSLAFP
jgi:hypothetical protein